MNCKNKSANLKGDDVNAKWNGQELKTLKQSSTRIKNKENKSAVCSLFFDYFSVSI